MFPNSDPVMFMVAFYGCLLAELVPVPIEVPLTRKVAHGASSGSWSLRLGPEVPHPVQVSSCPRSRRLLLGEDVRAGRGDPGSLAQMPFHVSPWEKGARTPVGLISQQKRTSFLLTNRIWDLMRFC